MTELKNITAQVKEILEKDKQTRSSDSLLYLRVLNRYCNSAGFDTSTLSVDFFLRGMEVYGPELSANKAVQAMRAEKQREYLDYARSDAP